MPYHVIRPENHRQDVFLREEGRTFYPDLPRDQAVRYSLPLLRY